VKLKTNREKEIFKNKDLIAKHQNFRGKNKDAHFSRRNNVVPKRTDHPLPPWNRGSHLNEKKNMMVSVRSIEHHQVQAHYRTNGLP
jgi:hypothetical protein